MDIKLLSRANEIQKQMATLHDARQKAIKIQQNERKSLNVYIGYNVELLTDALPIPIDDFIQMYLLSINKKLEELQKEFEEI